MSQATIDWGPEAGRNQGDAPALECRNLSKKFGDLQAVDDVSLRVERGQAYGLLGPNGAGKSTTIGMIVGLVKPDEGEVTVSGIDFSRHPNQAKGRIGYVPQEIALYPELSARENLQFFGRLYGLDGRAIKSRSAEVLEMVGLTDRAGDRIDTYSGGMKRRINIAAALLHEPELIILDEPTVGVDPQSRDSILAGVENLLTTGISLVYTSHYMEEVERLCDRVAIMDKGCVIAEGTKSELISYGGKLDRVSLTLEGDIDAAVVTLENVDEVGEAYRFGDEGGVALLCREGNSLLPRLISALGDTAFITSLEVERPNLEDTFLQLTGSSLRD